VKTDSVDASVLPTRGVSAPLYRTYLSKATTRLAVHLLGLPTFLFHAAANDISYSLDV